MNILIIGGTGFIGSALSRELRNSGHTVVVTTRQKTDPPIPPLDKGGQGGVMTWNPPALIPPDVISKFDAVVNLAGEQIAPGRWTAEKKERILSSRIITTHALVESIKQIPLKEDRGGLPKVLINASAVGYFGARGDEFLTEDSPPGSDFLASVCMKWEAEASEARAYGVRVVITRFGGVLEADGGMLPHIAIPFKLSFGGPIGSGKQWFSWVHRDDVIGIIKFALENETVSGPVNATAPNPVTNKEFTLALGKALNKPTYFAVPAFMVEFTLGEFGKVLLTGQRVLPEKILKAGYKFKYADINEALKAVFGKNA